MRILFHFYDLQQRAGIQRAICELSNALVEHGHEVIVATNTTRSDVTFRLDDRVIVTKTPYAEYQKTGIRAWPGKALWAVRQGGVLKDLISRYQPSVVVDHGTGLGLLYPFGSFGGIPFILQRHFPVDAFPHGKVLYRILSRVCLSKTVVVLTEAIARDMRSMGYRKIAVIPNVIPGDAKPAAYSDTNLRIGLLMGRAQNPQKGFDIFLKALAKTKQIDGWHFIIVGPGVDSDPILIDLIRKHQLDAQVSLLPATDDPYEYMRKSCCLIMPSRYEALPMVALEALSIGRPIIASDVDGLSELVITNVNGFVLPRGDIDALSDCLTDICRNPEQLRRLANNSCSSIARYDKRVIVEKWNKLVCSHEVNRCD